MPTLQKEGPRGLLPVALGSEGAKRDQAVGPGLRLAPPGLLLTSARAEAGGPVPHTHAAPGTRSLHPQNLEEWLSPVADEEETEGLSGEVLGQWLALWFGVWSPWCWCSS